MARKTRVDIGHPGHKRRFWAGAVTLLTFCLAAGLLQPDAHAQQLQLNNPLSIDRTPEVIEVPLTQVLKHLHVPPVKLHLLVAQNAANGQRIPSQLYSGKVGAAPDTLLLLVHLPAKGVENISFHLNPVAVPQQPLVFGREAPERKDDFAWENQLAAYRIYGPALEATGEICPPRRHGTRISKCNCS